MQCNWCTYIRTLRNIYNYAHTTGYRGGVWTAQSAAQNISDINHDVEVTGWGVTDDGTKFWQARNSWGTYWGEGQYCSLLLHQYCSFLLTADEYELKRKY
jgi:C1A family cysteine protease